MRTAILAVIAFLIFTGGAFYVMQDTSTQTAAAGASLGAQQSSTIFDLSRIVELLKQLLSLQTTTAHIGVTIPYATSTPVTATTSIAAPFRKPATVSATHATVQPTTSAAAPTTTSTQSPTQIALGLVLPNLRSALVNIVCLPVKEGNLKGISGSGIVIDSRGIILTVAHVAQYELLAEARPDLVTCFVRTGSPATNAYTAMPIFVSSAWVNKNSQTISSTDPTGTGENDFALLAITKSGTNAPLPSSFHAVSLYDGVSSIGDPVVIGSYGAEFLTSLRIRDDLFPTLVYGSVQDRFTFGSNTVDLISLGGGAAAQQGSSGGGIINQSGKLLGLITTSSTNSSLAARDLHAITMAYLQRAFTQESGSSLTSYITSDTPKDLVNSYAGKATSLANILVKANNL